MFLYIHFSSLLSIWSYHTIFLSIPKSRRFLLSLYNIFHSISLSHTKSHFLSLYNPIILSLFIYLIASLYVSIYSFLFLSFYLILSHNLYIYPKISLFLTLTIQYLSLYLSHSLNLSHFLSLSNQYSLSFYLSLYVFIYN